MQITYSIERFGIKQKAVYTWQIVELSPPGILSGKFSIEWNTIELYGRIIRCSLILINIEMNLLEMVIKCLQTH